MKEIKCENCGNILSGDDVNIDTGLARCSSCSAVFILETSDRKDMKSDEYYNNEFKNVEKPAGVEVRRTGHGFEIEKKHNPLLGVFLVFFALMWNTFLSVGGSAVFQSIDTPVLIVPFIPFAVIGLVILYMGIAMLINRIFITISMGELKLYQAPMPFPGKKTLRRGDIKQLYVKATEHRRSSSSTGSFSGSRYYTSYDLMVIKTSGNRMKLISLEKPEIALFIEKSIEEYLGIRDEHVHGEIEG